MKILLAFVLMVLTPGCALLGMSEDQIKEQRQEQATREWEAQNERRRKYRTEKVPVYLESGTVYMTQKEYDDKIRSGKIRRAGDVTVKVIENGKVVREIGIDSDYY